MSYMEIDKYTININNIAYYINESDKLVQIFFIGSNVALTLRNDNAREFIEKFNG